ncbi:9228_t:CDS:2 [Gigaspora rosea]|nr:9228_t:CDS:2 [Gigaspora rosea]
MLSGSKSSASTLCGTIVHTVATVAFGNYLSATTGLFLTFFRSPAKDDDSFFAKLRRYIILSASAQILGVICLMTYMTTRFFMLNNEVLPVLLSRCSIVMYSICGASALTTFVRIIYVTISTSSSHEDTKRSSHEDLLMPAFFEPYTSYTYPYGNHDEDDSKAKKEERDKKTHHLMLSGPLTVIQIIFFTLIYIIQMIFQVYMKIKFPSVGYMYTFQMISILSMLFTIPLFILIRCTKSFKKILYVFILPFVFQIYLHVGYISFYLYCDEGYLSSALLFISNFALGNVLHGAYYLTFGEMK